MSFIVDLGIPFNEDNQENVIELSNEIEELLEELGGLTASSGGGFGYRDIQIEFEEGSESQVEKIVKLKLEEQNIQLGNDPDDETRAYLSIYDKEKNK